MTKMTSLFDYQIKAISELRTGSILKGGVGSGKSLTGLGYFYIKECGGQLEPRMSEPTSPKDLYIITTARKRDNLDWVKEAAMLGISPDKTASICGIGLVIDSWNNITKYKEVENAFFIFDEQKVVGYGAWVKSFLKIAKNNNWILLSATPGDKWMDYVPVFIANGFFKNKTEFTREHVVFSPFTNFPKIDRYVGIDKLEKLKKKILVKMDYKKKTVDNIVTRIHPYDKEKIDLIFKKRWNPFTEKPVKGASEACYAMRRVVNSDPSRFESIVQLYEKHHKIIVFYNFDYELDILRRLEEVVDCPVTEYNGHIHEEIPNSQNWIYLVQYLSAGEAWNCILTNALILYSRNYSYRQTTQAMGRIDRQNTPFHDLYYYFLVSESSIDLAIGKAYSEKKNFNENKFIKI
jgi:hypothetical protein